MVAMDNKQNDLLLPRRGPEEIAIDNRWSVNIHKGTYNDSPNKHLYCWRVDKGLPRTATICNMDSLGGIWWRHRCRIAPKQKDHRCIKMPRINKTIMYRSQY